MINTIKLKEYPFVFKHIEGCGKDAYFVNHRPKRGHSVMADTLINIDGSKVVRCTYAKCGSCGKPIYLNSKFVFSRQDEVDHYFLTRTLNN